MDGLYEAIPYLALGVGTGVYGILVGAGGGVILAPALMIFFGVEPTVAAGTSLALVSINSVSGTVAYKRRGLVDIRSGWVFALSAVPGSIIAPMVLDSASTTLFKILFGFLLLLLALIILLRPQYREDESVSDSSESDQEFDTINRVPSWLDFTLTDRNIVTRRGNTYKYRFNESLSAFFNLLLGFISSFFGTGGGFLRTPILVSVFGFPVHVAVATSIFSLSIYATVGALVHVYLGHVDWYPALVWSGLGLIIGGQIGARLVEVIKGVIILRILLVVVMIMGIQLILQGAWPSIFTFTGTY